MSASTHALSATSSSATRLRVRVVPGAASSGVVGRLGDAWKVRVRAPAERGRANGELLSVLAAALGARRAELRVVAGHAARDKVLEVDNLALDEAERRLASGGKDAR